MTLEQELIDHLMKTHGITQMEIDQAQTLQQLVLMHVMTAPTCQWRPDGQD